MPQRFIGSANMPRKETGKPLLILLDNEAVQALIDTRHTKHADALAFVEADLVGKQAKGAISLHIPTAVRVEAEWDRTSRSVHVPRVRFHDMPLGAGTANVAARVKTGNTVSVADAHLGAEIANAATDQRICVITSDHTDPAAMAASVNRPDARMCYL